MNYKILINKNAVPVLIEASNNADPDTWFSLEDEFHHIRFKDEEQVRNLLSPEEFRLHRIGQTFPLPTGYKVSFEHQIKSIFSDDHWNNISDEGYNHYLNNGAGFIRKLAILSKLEEPYVVAKLEIPAEAVSKLESVVAPSEEVKHRKSELKETMSKISEAIRNNKKNQPLTPEQIEGVIEWMNGWEQLKGTAIPIRFKEDFS